MDTKAFHDASSLTMALMSGALLALTACEAEPEDATRDESALDEPDDEEGEALRVWSGYTSEEFPPLMCNNGQLVRGFDCQGRYCDNVSIDCYASGAAYGSSSWTSFFSEEGSGTADERICAWGEFVTGIACNGRYCDNLSLLCTEAIGRGIADCQWSGWYSEESGPFQALAGRYIVGVECNGSYCDDKRYRHCQMI